MNPKRIISFPPKPEAQITQRELVQERVMAKTAASAVKALEAKRADIRRRIEAGVQVEEGHFTAELSPRRSDGHEYLCLIIR